MAFMMPVVKNDYNIYPNRPRSRPSISSCAPSAPQSRCSSLSSSPGRSEAASFMGSPQSSITPCGLSSPKSGSQTSLHRFHSKLVDKLRNALRSNKSDRGSFDGIPRPAKSPA